MDWLWFRFARLSSGRLAAGAAWGLALVLLLSGCGGVEMPAGSDDLGSALDENAPPRDLALADLALDAGGAADLATAGDGALPGDASAAADLAATPDAAMAVDQAAFMDLSAPRDQSGPVDQASIPDLTTIPDLVSIPDLTRIPDLAMIPDLSIIPDLASFPDLSQSPDLSTPDDLAAVADLSVPADQSVMPDLLPPADLAPAPDLAVPDFCFDRVKDKSETDVDCGGGMCMACGAFKTCGQAADCLSKLCTNGHCQQPAHCIDGLTDFDETDVDCGGSCAGCLNGNLCGLNNDCNSGFCSAGRCASMPSCMDGVRNGLETDVDCGGPTCAACGLGKGCARDVDCSLGTCVGLLCTPAPRCTDGFKNGSETDVDCGGSCPPCGAARACANPIDCVSQVCAQGACAPAKLTLDFRAAPSTYTALNVYPSRWSTGDYNNDGKTDIVYADTFSPYIQLGDGTGRFGRAVVPAMVQNPDTVAGGDFDGDGKRDLIITVPGKAYYLRGNGDGSFVAQVPIASFNSNGMSETCGWTSAADWNGDGLLDFACGGAKSFFVVPGDGKGGFGMPLATPLSPVGQVVSAVVGDFNHDGRRDLALALYYTYQGPWVHSPIEVLLGVGNGTFMAAEGPLSIVGNGFTMAGGDWNGDGNTDLVVDSDANNVFSTRLYLGDGKGKFTVGATNYAGGNLSGDWNLDGVFDFLTPAGHLYLGNGDATFNDRPFPALSGSDATGDWNGDMKPDLLIGANYIQLYAGDGKGNFASDASYGGCFLVTGLAIADLDGDGHRDVVVLCSFDLYWMKGAGDGTFSAWGNPLKLPFSTTQMVIADVNRDRIPDLLTLQMNSAFVYVALGKGNGSFAAPAAQAAMVNSQNYALATGDFNQDGLTDLIVSSAVDVEFWRGKGDGTFSIDWTAMSTGGSALAVGDVDGDGALDFVVSSLGGSSEAVFRGNVVNGKWMGFKAAQPLPRPAGGKNLVLADIDGDGRADLTYGGFKYLPVMQAAGFGNFLVDKDTTTWNLNLDNTLVVDAADYNLDGKVDVAAVDGGQLGLFIGAHMPIFSDPIGWRVADKAHGPIATGDLDGDGKPDLVIPALMGQGQNEGVHILLNTSK